MCGRYTLFVPPGVLEDRFDATFTFDFQPRYNAAPGQSLPVIPDVAPDSIRAFEWSYVPSWADERPSNSIINARAETLGAKPSFRPAVEGDGAGTERRSASARTDSTPGSGGRRTDAGRCLVLADGFYEWGGGPNGSQPYRLSLASNEPFAMAGLFSRWVPRTTQAGLGEFGGDGPDDETDAIWTFAIVTTEPNDLVSEVHDRMPVVLPRDGERRWLAEPFDVAESLLRPFPADEMKLDAVSRLVNDPSNDSPAVLGPDSAGP